MEAQESIFPAAACGGCLERDRRIAALEQRNAALEQRNAALERRLAQLECLVDQLRRGGKRQAAPFSKGPPKDEPKKPGRKAGDDYGTKAFRAAPPEQQIDEVHDAPLPDGCPGCGAAVIESHVDHQYQTEIPRRPIHRQFDIHVGRCGGCGRRVRGRHRLQTSDAVGCCASQLGPEAQAAAVMLNKELGLSQGKISRLFQGLFGIRLSRGASCQMMLRAADRCEDNYRTIIEQLQKSETTTADETGWRIGGRRAWLHTAASEKAVAYAIDAKRGFEASQKLLGANYAGILIHDGYASYDRFRMADHQTCLAHLLRRCREMLEIATRGAVIFPRKVRTLLKEALAIRDRREAGEIPFATAAGMADVLGERMHKLLKPIKINGPNERLAAHLWKHRDQLFTFLERENVEATNWRAEQAIRPAVVNRKVWGGNRTQAGALAQSILMTVLATAARNGRDVLEFVSQVLRSPPDHRPLLPGGGG